MKKVKFYIFALLLLSSYVFSREFVDDVYDWQSEEEEQSATEKTSKKAAKKNEKASIDFIEDGNQLKQHPDTVRAVIKRKNDKN